MKVILLSDVKNVGKKGEVVDVKDGYAKNFLLAKKLAVKGSEESLKILNKQKEEKALYEKDLENKAIKLREELKNREFSFKLKANKGKLSNSVSSKMIADRLNEEGYEIDKRKIIEPKTITSLGYTNVKVELYKNVFAVIKILVEEA